MVEPKPVLRVMLMGHVDSGKSTLAGHLLLKCTGARTPGDEDLLPKAYYHARLFSSLSVSLELPNAPDVSSVSLDSFRRRLVLMDTPGNRDYTRSLLAGIAVADAALLLIDASVGAFEAGFARDGWTRLHASIALIYGVERIIFCINKLDDRSCTYSKARFDEIVLELTNFMRKRNLDLEKVRFIPLCANLGFNLVEPFPEGTVPWYDGPTLLGELDCLPVPAPCSAPPSRVLVTRSVEQTEESTVFSGILVCGTLRVGDTLRFASEQCAQLFKIEHDFTTMSVVEASKDTLVLSVCQKIDALECGTVACMAEGRLPWAIGFTARLQLPNKALPCGKLLHAVIAGTSVGCYVSRILSTGSDSKGAEGGSLLLLPAYRQEMFEITLEKPAFVEPFEVCQRLGTVYLRDSEAGVACIAFGRVTDTVRAARPLVKSADKKH
eukprot:TRINITY_DN6730_c0_g1_i1.p1 TRINITY_DN6730_c0_g1~~TRINITY_DN6730_c0_g1_i1.p1  ORF type:complete len:445 (-),score=47.50 TRINITY_DN6730_c0_g1_i1:1040-2353(-)